MEDNVLKNIAEQQKPQNHIWGNYQHIYDWHWDEAVSKPAMFPKSFEHAEIASAVMLRDWSIAYKLSELGIKTVLDVGADTGHLMAVLKANGIEAVGVDTNPGACDHINSHGTNLCYNAGIQELIKLKALGNQYDCVSCLNITHVKWEDEKLKNEFVEWIGENFKYCILSDMSGQSRNWKKLKLLYDFNHLPFRFNWLVYKILYRLKLSSLVTYRSMHKLYKTTK